MAARTAFAYPLKTPSWFAGHMAKSLRDLPALLEEVDLVLEARDSRLPLTSVNPAFDSVLEHVWGHAGAGPDRRGKGKEKLVVYTKRDLAEQRYEAPLRRAFKNLTGQRIHFANSGVDADVRAVLQTCVSVARARGDTLTDLRVLVVGMPNVGKSSLLNALRRVGVRKGKAFTTGAMPGVTRKLTGTVKVHAQPPVYVFDTPGVMVPYLGHSARGAERGLKLALTAGIKEGLFEPEAVADYLLYKLNLRLASEGGFPPGLQETEGGLLHTPYTQSLGLRPDAASNDINAFLSSLAARLGGLRRGGELDTEGALVYFLRAFREGKLGPWTLDDLDGAEEAYVAQHGESPEPEANMRYSDLGAVGVLPSSPLSTPSPTPPDSTTFSLGEASDAGGEPIASLGEPEPAFAPTPLSLDQRVMLSVGRFLDEAAEERADADAGRNRSPTQVKKQARRAKMDERIAKAEARRARAAKAGGRR